MTLITGYHHVSLTVTDVARSAAWYGDVLGFAVEAESEGVGYRRTRLRHRQAGISLTLTRHDDGEGEPFSERRTGLDHLAFAVPSVELVEAFRRRFKELGVVHSELKPHGRGPGDGAVVTLRDPDNVQLEVFAPRTAD